MGNKDSQPKFSLSEIYTASTASEVFKIPYSTLKDDLTRYHKFNKCIENGLVKKEGKVWIITKEAIETVYKTKKNLLQEKENE